MKIIRILIGVLLLLTGVNAKANVWDDVKKATVNMKESIETKVDALMAPSADNTSEIIEKIENFTPKFIEIRRDQKAAPKKKIFGKDKDHYEKKAQEKLSEIQELLFDKKIIGQSERIKQIAEKIDLLS